MFITHPSMAPGAIIGYRKNGTPIRLLAGGSGEGEGEPTTTQDGGTTVGTGDHQTADPAGTGGQPSAGAGTQGQPTTPAAQGDDSAARTIAAIREDYKTERSRRQALEKQLAELQTAHNTRAEEDKARNLALAKAFGFAPDEPPDPAKLAADLKAAQEQTAAEIAKREARERELTIELETRRRAGKLGADPDLLADSRSFMKAAAKLDPASDSFGEDLADAITKAVEANPSLKAATGSTTTTTTADAPKAAKSATTAPPARSGGEHNGAPGGQRQWTKEDVDRASPSEVAQAARDGHLVALGVNPPRSRR